MSSHVYLATLNRLLSRGSERKRLRQLSLAYCLAPLYADALEARELRQASVPTIPTVTHR